MVKHPTYTDSIGQPASVQSCRVLQGRGRGAADKGAFALAWPIIFLLAYMLVGGTRADDAIEEAVPAPSDSWRWHIRPRGFVYSTYWASNAEPRLATQLFHEHEHGTLLDSTIGGRVGLLRFGPRDYPEGFQLDVLAGAKLRQDGEHELDVLGTDYRFDILGTYARDRHGLKFGFYHVSSHAGDEFLLRHPGFQRLNYSQDTMVLGYSFYPVPEVRLYAEAGWAFRQEISEPWEFQFGVDMGPRNATGVRGAPFLAANAHLRQELDFGGNFAFQAGWAWRGEDAWDGLLRTGVYFYDGGSPQFSFYRVHEQHIGWGVWYDF